MLARRLILVPIGLVLAVAAGFIFLLIAGLAEPAGRKVLEGVGWMFLLAVHADAMRGEPQTSFLALAARIMWWAVLAIVVAPVLLGALIGEVAKLRSITWHVGLPAVLTAAIPWLANAAKTAGGSAIHDAAARGTETGADQARLALVLLLSGAVRLHLLGRRRARRRPRGIGRPRQHASIAGTLTAMAPPPERKARHLAPRLRVIDAPGAQWRAA